MGTIMTKNSPKSPAQKMLTLCFSVLDVSLYMLDLDGIKQGRLRTIRDPKGKRKQTVIYIYRTKMF